MTWTWYALDVYVQLWYGRGGWGQDLAAPPGSLRDAWQTLQPPLKAALYWLVSWLAGLGRDLVQNQPCDLQVRWTFSAQMPAVKLCNDRKILWNHVYWNRNSLKKYQWSIFKTEFSSELFPLFFPQALISQQSHLLSIPRPNYTAVEPFRDLYLLGYPNGGN